MSNQKNQIHIRVSQQNLTRCQGCSRYHQIEATLSSASLLALRCEFCGDQLIGDQSQPASSLKVSALSTRSSRLAMGLLSAGLMLGGCERDEETTTAGMTSGTAAGAMAGMTAGETAGMTAGETAGMTAGETAGMTAGEREVAGEVIVAGVSAGIEPIAMYGAPPPIGGNEGGDIVIGGVEEAGLQALYGGPPDIGGTTEAGETAGGEEAGVVEFDLGVIESDAAIAPAYGAAPAGEEG